MESNFAVDSVPRSPMEGPANALRLAHWLSRSGDVHLEFFIGGGEESSALYYRPQGVLDPWPSDGVLRAASMQEFSADVSPVLEALLFEAVNASLVSLRSCGPFVSS